MNSDNQVSVSNDSVEKAKQAERKMIINFLLEKHKGANGMHNYYLSLANEIKAL